MNSPSHGADARRSLHPSHVLALVVGAVYTLMGLAGFAVTGFDQWVGVTGEHLLGFEVNGLHNVVHLVIGLLGLALSRALSTARSYGWILALGYGLTFLFGLLAVGNPNLNVLSLNGTDNVLHLASALTGLVIALWPARRAADARDRRIAAAR